MLTRRARSLLLVLPASACLALSVAAPPASALPDPRPGRTAGPPAAEGGAAPRSGAGEPTISATTEAGGSGAPGAERAEGAESAEGAKGSGGAARSREPGAEARRSPDPASAGTGVGRAERSPSPGFGAEAPVRETPIRPPVPEAPEPGPGEESPSPGAPVQGGAAASEEVAASIRSRQWALRRLEVERVWQYARGDGVTVAVLDTGVDDRHPDLAGRVVTGPDLTGVKRERGPHWGRHGTSMASLIAGRGHGPGNSLGVLGVAPSATILSIRVTLENGDPERDSEAVQRGSRDAVARGIRYAVDHGAQVISMSLGGGRSVYDGNAAEEEAVQYALAKGAVLVASSGNDGADANRRNFPAAYPGVIAVGAVDRDLKRAPFSNRQNHLSVVAPGTQIVSADGAGDYVVGDGTSSAAAHVAGIAALLRGRYPDLTAPQIRRAIEQGTTRRPKGGHNAEYGHGVANAWLALLMAHKASTGRSIVPSAAAPSPAPVAEYFGGGPLEYEQPLHRAAGFLLIVLAVCVAVGGVLTLRRRPHD
ncbi:S8 family peptidase [Bailinhaonella thermotolerans]|uniref:Type VII secretion-associated serine protease mycosin n=1 Tax=Bailinhaonella thermotolerans TaxID=1070861 RepID=A0A3A4BF78_9ACTN|nr:S8 family serine peptidase [Bailinhaonella thermotolerans]RJL33122.1 type VII secretion-associated serine protease mycosin [Bailinhaonella thermotolerans]